MEMPAHNIELELMDASGAVLVALEGDQALERALAHGKCYLRMLSDVARVRVVYILPWGDRSVYSLTLAGEDIDIQEEFDLEQS